MKDAKLWTVSYHIMKFLHVNLHEHCFFSHKTTQTVKYEHFCIVSVLWILTLF